MLGDLSMNLRIHVSRQAWWSASEISVLEVRRVEEEWKWGGGGVGRVCLAYPVRPRLVKGVSKTQK